MNIEAAWKQALDTGSRHYDFMGRIDAVALTRPELEQVIAAALNGKPKRPHKVVTPRGDAEASRDERISYALDSALRDRNSRQLALTTARLDEFLRASFGYVGSLTKKISNYRYWLRQQGIGELRCFEKRQDGVRVCYYFLEKP